MTLRFLPRAQALSQNPAFAAAFCALQRAVFDEQPRLWEGEVPQQVPPDHVGNRVWRAVGRSTRTDHYAARLARALGLLLPALGAAWWSVLPLHRHARWAGADEAAPAYPPLARARAGLLQAEPGRPAMGSRFAGALQFDAASATQAVPLWFWVSRCGALPGEAYAAADELPLLASLCQYGNLHLSVYDRGLLRRLDRVAAGCGFAPIDGLVCRELFGHPRRPGIASVKAVGIAGRGLRV